MGVFADIIYDLATEDDEDVSLQRVIPHLQKIKLKDLDINSFLSNLSPNPKILKIIDDFSEFTIHEVITNAAAHEILIKLAADFGVNLSNLDYDQKVLKIPGIKDVLKIFDDKVRIGLTIFLKNMTIRKLTKKLLLKEANFG